MTFVSSFIGGILLVGFILEFMCDFEGEVGGIFFSNRI